MSDILSDTTKPLTGDQVFELLGRTRKGQPILAKTEEGDLFSIESVEDNYDDPSYLVIKKIKQEGGD